MRIITVSEAGTTRAEEAQPPAEIAPGQVRVRVRYAGIGFADVMAVQGRYPLAPSRPFSPGYEFMGEVIGGSLTSGTRVVGILPQMGAYREIVDVEPHLLARVPDGLADEAAAALPLNYLTAYALIDRCARLRQAESLVIHGAAGGVGTAVLELSRVLGLRAYGRASRSKHGVVRSFGATALDRDEWMSELRREQPGGVEAAFDALGVASFRQSWRALSRTGTLVCYGLASSTRSGTRDFVQGLGYLAGKWLLGGSRRVRICSVPWLVRTDGEWVASSLARIVEWAGAGALRPLVAGVRAWHEVEGAHRVLATAAASGKFLLEFA